MLAPGRFIPAAENTGLILPLTEEVLHQALGAVTMWRSHGVDLTVAVNVTARHVTNLELPNQVSATLAAHDLPGNVLILEVTESCLMSDPGRARIVLDKLRAAGVLLSIDDFGTGYSSFSNLRDLAVNEIKIDRTFVTGLEDSETNGAIVKSAIELGHNLGLQVVAEGVETQSCLDILTGMGCDLVQGYLFAQPMSAQELLAWATSRHADFERAPEMSRAC
jgi:EAL domain-containing protein (putative c-di-GMP-specific phosphodiesterase class I)